MDEFAAFFQKEYDRITRSIQKLEISQLPETQTAITRLSDQVRDASSSLPAHDRKIYDGRIKDLQQKLKERQTAIAPKKKFAFASKSTLSARKTEPELKAHSLQSTNGNTMAETAQAAEGTKIKTLTYENLSDARIESGPDGELAAGRPCYLSNLSSCIVDLRSYNSTTSTLASLTARDVNDSIIVCDYIDGPLHLTSIRNSIIVASGRQFRMHKSQDCDIYLQMTSRAIIEDCSDIRFTELPDFLRKSIGEQADNIEVDDFNWHRSEPSPNWSVLEDTEIIKSDAWQALLTDKSLTVKDVLKGVRSAAVANAVT